MQFLENGAFFFISRTQKDHRLSMDQFSTDDILSIQLINLWPGKLFQTWFIFNYPWKENVSAASVLFEERKNNENNIWYQYQSTKLIKIKTTLNTFIQNKSLLSSSWSSSPLSHNVKLWMHANICLKCKNLKYFSKCG